MRPPSASLKGQSVLGPGSKRRRGPDGRVRAGPMQIPTTGCGFCPSAVRASPLPRWIGWHPRAQAVIVACPAGATIAALRPAARGLRHPGRLPPRSSRINVGHHTDNQGVLWSRRSSAPRPSRDSARAPPGCARRSRSSSSRTTWRTSSRRSSTPRTSSPAAPWWSAATAASTTGRRSRSSCAWPPPTAWPGSWWGAAASSPPRPSPA